MVVSRLTMDGGPGNDDGEGLIRGIGFQQEFDLGGSVTRLDNGLRSYLARSDLASRPPLEVLRKISEAVAAVSGEFRGELWSSGIMPNAGVWAGEGERVEFGLDPESNASVTYGVSLGERRIIYRSEKLRNAKPELVDGMVKEIQDLLASVLTPQGEATSIQTVIDDLRKVSLSLINEEGTLKIYNGKLPKGFNNLFEIIRDVNRALHRLNSIKPEDLDNQTSS